MNTNFMRFVDYYLGIPLCALLTLWHLSVGRFISRKNKEPKKILFIELSEMGSAILAFASVEAAQKNFSESEVFFLIFERNADSAKVLGIIPPENIFVIKDHSFSAFASSALKVLLQVRKKRIDTVVDMELFSRFTSIFSFFSGAGNRVGFHNYTQEGLFRGEHLSKKVYYNPYKHMSENFLNLILALKPGLSDVPLLKELPPSDSLSPAQVSVPPALRREIQSRLGEDYCCSSPRIILNMDPGPELPIRGWPEEHFNNLATQLLEIYPQSVIILMGLERAGRRAAKLLEHVCGTEHFPSRVVNFTGKTQNLFEMLALFEAADLLITIDSGPAHVASLSRITAISLFGPETPALYGALGENKHALYANFSCSPCLTAANHRKTVCKDNKCLQIISPQLVLNKAQECLTNMGIGI